MGKKEAHTFFCYSAAKGYFYRKIKTGKFTSNLRKLVKVCGSKSCSIFHSNKTVYYSNLNNVQINNKIYSFIKKMLIFYWPIFLSPLFRRRWRGMERPVFWDESLFPDKPTLPSFFSSAFSLYLSLSLFLSLSRRKF